MEEKVFGWDDIPGLGYKFHALCAFHAVNLAQSNAAQSAPWSTARYSEDQWQAIETALQALTLKDFLLLASMGTGSDEDTLRTEELGNIPALSGWLNTFD